MAERVDHQWTVGPYTFEAVSRHGFPESKYPPVMYRYRIDGKRVDHEMYESLDRAIVSAVGARHTGPRGAGGPGVGTAADWFCKMIELHEAEAEQRAEAAPAEQTEPEVCPGSRTGWMTTESGVGGYIAKCRACGGHASDLNARPELAGDRYLGWTPEHAPVNR